MKLKKLALTPLFLVAGFVAYATLHPGVAYAEPTFQGPATTPTVGGDYKFDDQHADFSFEITHLGLSRTRGRFNKFEGKIHEDVKDLSKSTVEFSAEIDSVDTAVAARDAHLKTADFFDAAKFPRMTFKSTKVEKTDTGYKVTGDLTIKDKTKEVVIPFKHYGPYTLTVGDNSTRVGIVAEEIKIKRSDFGVGAQFKMPDGTEGSSDEVLVRISFEGLLVK